MKTPLFLMAASLLFWGWQTGLWMFAVIMAFMLEGARFVRIRWEFSLSDFSRIADVCTLIFVGTVIYLFASEKPARIIFIVLQWMPLSFFPLLMFQEYSTAGKVDIRALSLILRKQDKDGSHSSFAVDLTYPYLGLCMLSASAANMRTPWFYAGIVILSVWGLAPVRSRRFMPAVWITMIAMAAVAGYIGHIGLNRLQSIIEQKGIEWFADSIRDDADPYHNVTAIGDIGTLKFSDRILFRVTPVLTSLPGSLFPLLLREAGYNMYQYARWFAMGGKFSEIQPDDDKTTWKLSPEPETFAAIRISAYLREGKGMLKLPAGTFEIKDLPVSKMERNPIGAVRVEEGPGMAAYTVKFGSHVAFDSLPNNSDLSVPQREISAVNEVIRKLDIASKPPDEILNRVTAFFRNNFTYSLTQNSQAQGMTPVAFFLRRSLSGHCEYFATATVLILRAAGIPARYTTGYLVHEFSPFEKCFIVREKDAHAWVSAYIRGEWQAVDTTPPAWIKMRNDSLFPYLSDLWSWFVFTFSDWRWRNGEDRVTKHSIWLLIPLFIILVRRLYFSKQVKRISAEKPSESMSHPVPGADSDFYQIEKKLGESGFARYPWETLSVWIRRIESHCGISVVPLYALLKLHYRYRFDPEGIFPDERVMLKAKAEEWLSKNGTFLSNSR